jgi:hypothetical protein
MSNSTCQSERTFLFWTISLAVNHYILSAPLGSYMNWNQRHVFLRSFRISVFEEVLISNITLIYIYNITA